MLYTYIYMKKIKCAVPKEGKYIHVHVHEKNQVCSAERSLFQAFGPHQQGVAQSLPGTTGAVITLHTHLGHGISSKGRRKLQISPDPLTQELGRGV